MPKRDWTRPKVHLPDWMKRKVNKHPPEPGYTVRRPAPSIIRAPRSASPRSKPQTRAALGHHGSTRSLSGIYFAYSVGHLAGIGRERRRRAADKDDPFVIRRGHGRRKTRMARRRALEATK